ncbi:MAG: hypothetical protein ACYC2E_06390 [Sulfuricella sp.]
MLLFIAGLWKQTPGAAGSKLALAATVNGADLLPNNRPIQPVNARPVLQ